MRSQKNFDNILYLIEHIIKPKYLNNTQEIVLRETWNGKTYSQIAYEHNYDTEYIKTVGCDLWQTLSSAFDEQVNKSNFVSFMRQKINSDLVNSQKNLTEALSEQTSNKPVKPQKYHWNIAPSTKNFIGREKELKLLESMIQEPECRFIMVSGMVGCGKTSLVTKFSESYKNLFDYVIWSSLDSPLSLRILLNNYLEILNTNSKRSLDYRSEDVGLLISQLVECLKQNKILLILDGLENVLKIDHWQVNIQYKPEFEDYSQFIRSIISAKHQSVAICTTQIRPRIFEYYSNKQVKLLELCGLNNQTLEEAMDFDSNNPSMQSRLLQIYNNFQNNPRLIEIVNTNLSIYDESDISLLMHELISLEEIALLLEKELDCLSNLGREIVYWLSISCEPVRLNELLVYLELYVPKLKFTQCLASLEKRNLITQRDNAFHLMPIMKEYLRKRLVKKSLHLNN